MGTSQDFTDNIANYYSLMELLEKLGKEKVAALVSKGKPKKVVQGEMIYFAREDIVRLMQEFLPQDLGLLGVSSATDDESMDLLVDGVSSDSIETNQDVLNNFIFKATFVRRFDLEHDEVIYEDQEISLAEEICYGRTHGDPDIQNELRSHKIISSLHSRLFLDEEGNLLYQNFGANKSKVRGCQDRNYQTLAQNEIAVLVKRDNFQKLMGKPEVTLQVSIKIGWQEKPHYIIRININKKSEQMLEN